MAFLAAIAPSLAGLGIAVRLPAGSSRILGGAKLAPESVEEALRMAGGVTISGKVKITKEGIDIVIKHLSRFKDDPGMNQAMVNRLRERLGTEVTGADANFYVHEILEYYNMAAGMGDEAAHLMAFDQAAASPFSVYHPDVVRQFRDALNAGYRRYWGIE
jgi:hypothetical protein